MTYADVTSTIAIVISAGILSWQIFSGWRQAPKVTLQGGLTFDINDEGAAYLLTAAVTNTGRDPVTVSEMYWEIFLRESQTPGAARLMQEDMGPSLPCRLEGYGFHQWRLRVEPSHPHLQRRRLRPIAEVILPKGALTLVGNWETLEPPEGLLDNSASADK